MVFAHSDIFNSCTTFQHIINGKPKWRLCQGWPFPCFFLYFVCNDHAKFVNSCKLNERAEKPRIILTLWTIRARWSPACWFTWDHLRFYLALTLAAPVIWPCRAILRLLCRLFGIYDARSKRELLIGPGPHYFWRLLMENRIYQRERARKTAGSKHVP